MYQDGLIVKFLKSYGLMGTKNVLAEGINYTVIKHTIP